MQYKTIYYIISAWYKIMHKYSLLYLREDFSFLVLYHFLPGRELGLNVPACVSLPKPGSAGRVRTQSWTQRKQLTLFLGTAPIGSALPRGHFLSSQWGRAGPQMSVCRLRAGTQQSSSERNITEGKKYKKNSKCRRQQEQP